MAKAIVALLLLPTVAALRNTVTPIQKVVGLLQRLTDQVSEEGHREAAEYDKYACFCKEQANAKLYAISKSNEKLGSLTALITALDADITDLNSEVQTLVTEIADLKTEIGNATTKRTAAHANYTAADKTMVDAVDAVERAITALKNSKSNMQGAKLDLVALGSVLTLAKMRDGDGSAEKLESMLQAGQSPAAFEYSSNDIIATLKSLKIQFLELKKTADQEEFDSRSTSEKKVLGLTNEKKFKAKSQTEKEALAADKSVDKHTAEQDKTEETTARDADQAFLDQLVTQCESRATEWDQRSTSRAAELTAMTDAIEQLKNVNAKYGANSKLVGLQVAQEGVPSFVQVRNHHRNHRLAKVMHSALERLQQAAERLHSPKLAALARLAASSGAAADHFVKVRGIIKDLIAKLEADALSEATAKTLCDSEMGSATSSRDTQRLAMEEQTALISEKTSAKAQLEREIVVLSEEIADLNKALVEATELRGDEKAANAKTIADATSGKTSCNQAITLLNAYYDSQGGTLLQMQNSTANRDGETVDDMAPEMSYSGDYSGKTDAKKGVIGLLDVIVSDFTRTISTVTDDEASAVTAFTAFETATTTSINTKKGEKTTKEGEITTAEQAITDAKDDLKDAEDLHGDALELLEKLHSSCVEGEESWKERRQKRDDEIEALKNAMQILEEWQN